MIALTRLDILLSHSKKVPIFREFMQEIINAEIELQDTILTRKIFAIIGNVCFLLRIEPRYLYLYITLKSLYSLPKKINRNTAPPISYPQVI